MARSSFRRRIRSTLAALACALVFPSGEFVLLAQQDKPPAPPEQPAKPEQPPKEGAAAEKPAVPPDTTKKEPGAEQAKITNDELDALVAPIALYPDSLLAQVLVASTYPLEIVQLHQWLEKNKAQKEKALKDKALVDAVAKQPWDPSIQSMAALPDVVKRLADDVQWTTGLGNAFLAQQADVMDAVQRMRKKAQDKGALKSNEQQKVSEEKAGEPPKTVIIVESANPEVVYVPAYSPTVVYGAAIYPYPPIYYPPYPPGAAFVSFSIGVMWGAAIWGGSCCGCGWGGGDVDINVNNNFNRNEINTGGRNQVNTGDRGGAGGTGGRGGASAGTSDRPGGGGGAGGGGQKWSHNPSHRGGTPYSDKATASKYGGDARGQANAGNRAMGGGASAATRPSTGMGGTGAGPGGSAGRPGGGSGTGPSAGTMDRGGGGAGGAGGDRIGSRDIPSSGGRGGSSGRGGYSGGGFGSSGSYSGGSARSSSSRGSRSMGGRSFGGGGGGGRRR
jgi:hypothetical protein